MVLAGFVLLLILFVFTVFYGTLTEGFESSRTFKELYELPLKVYVVQDMEIDHPQHPDEPIDSWMSLADAKTAVEAANAKFFHKHGIHWRATYEYVQLPDYSGRPQDMQTLATVERPTTPETIASDKLQRANIYRRIMDNSAIPDSNATNLYFVTFTGNTRQGTANAPYVIMGQWTNKQSTSTNKGNLRKRTVDDIEGYPSMAFTVAHELGHILGLRHLNTNESNIMNATTSSFIATPEQIATMKDKANLLAVAQGTINTDVTGLTVQKIPIVDKRYIPESGVLPRGYYKINRYQMAAIPEAYYVFDENNMAEIPDGFQASEDKQYVFRTSSKLEETITRAESYNPKDFSAYHNYKPVETTDPNTTTAYKQQPTTRDPRQFLRDGQDIQFTSDTDYVNNVINQQNPSIRETDYRGNAPGDYRASPSYSFYDNHTLINTTATENTPGQLGGFCEQNKHSQMEIEKQCSKLGTHHCASTNCCVLLGNSTCVAGNEQGPSYQDHYRNPAIPDRDYYYYKGKCYGNCKHH